MCTGHKVLHEEVSLSIFNAMAALRCTFCICHCRKNASLKINQNPILLSLCLGKSNLQRCYSISESHKAEIKPVRKKRDKLTVLKALSSTVEKIPNRPDYRFYDDLILNPRSLIKQKELLLSLESGYKTADYVLETYPDLFPLRKAVPSWPEINLSANIEDTAENLKLLMKSKENAVKALELYERLKSSNEVNIEVHNSVLDFVSFHSLSNPSSNTSQVVQQSEAEQQKLEGDQGDSSSSSSSSSSSEEENSQIADQPKSTWKSGGYAESLFNELKEAANAQTYEVYILGLIQNKELIQAFHLVKEFHEKKFQGSTHLYNTLLQHVCDVREGDTNRWDMAQEIVGYMKQCGQSPDVVTFNELLSIAYTMADQPELLCQQILREMKKVKITPSLGSYYFVLLAERKKDYQDIHVLFEIINDLKRGTIDFSLQHPSDIMFFHSAMDLARFKRNGSIAKDLLKVVLDNGLQHMLGAKNSSFFGNYICAIARNAPTLEEVFVEYERIVPKYLIPRDWVFQQLLLASRNHKNPEHVPRLYTDMVSMRVPLSERAAHALFAAMDVNVPKERAEEYLHVALDSSKWMGVFNVKMSTEISSTIIKLLCLCEKYNEAREMISELSKQEIVPSVNAMSCLLELNLKQENKEAALHTLKLMSDYKMVLPKETKDSLAQNALLQDKQAKIESWFVDVK